MGRKFDFDYIVIGSGPAGRGVARNLAKRNRIAIVEAREFGGTDINADLRLRTGMDFASHFRVMKESPAALDLSFNLPTLASQGARISRLFATREQKLLEDLGVTVIFGLAHFLDENTLAVGKKEFTAKNFVIATGAGLNTSGISGLDAVDYLTPEMALNISRPPKTIVVVGAGPTGCEIANFYGTLGIETVLIESGARILPREDKEISEVLTQRLTRLGVMIATEAKVVAVEQRRGEKNVVFKFGGKEKIVQADAVVIATGTAANTDLGLENAEVKYDKSGILTDKYFRTSARNIFAVGDDRGDYESSTERAEYEARVLSSNLLGSGKTSANYTGFIRQVKTYPEIAVVGKNERDLKREKIKARKAMVYFDDLTAKIAGFDFGLCKIICDRGGRIIGAAVVAPNAAEIAAELALAIRHKIRLEAVANTPRVSSDFNSIVREAARKLVK